MRILHISDVHFSTESTSSSQSRISKVLVDAVRDFGSVIDYCVFTGDLANKATNEEYKLAEKWLKDIYEAIDNPCVKMIICPGNHDVSRKKADVASLRGASISQKVFNSFTSKSPRNIIHLNVFLEWHDNFKSSNPWIISDWSENVTFVSDEFEGRNINFVMANSALLSCDNDDKGYLCIDITQLDGCLDQCYDNKGLNIGLMHHPIDQGWYSDWNEKELIRLSNQKNSFHFLMTGHVHDANVGSYSNNLGQNLTQFQCGSAYTGSDWKKEFLIIELDFDASKVKPINYVFSDASGEWIANNEQSRTMSIELPNTEVKALVKKN